MEVRNLQRRVRVNRKLIDEAAGLALAAGGATGREVSLALVGDRRMAVLNRRHTGRCGPTDVLAFPIEEGDYLGEVIISTDTCRRQALEEGKPFRRELALLVIHGVLHLCGYDHTGDAAGALVMRRLERRLLKKVFPMGGSSTPPCRPVRRER